MSFLLNTVGVDLTLVDTTAHYNLGQRVFANDGVYQYVKAPASAAIAQYAMVKIDDDYTVAEGTTTLLPNTEPAKVGIAQVAVASSTSVQYLWVFVGPGLATCKFAASCVQDVKIYTTATAGVVDDSATTLINGLKLITTITGAAASPCWAVTELTTVAA